MNNKIYILFGFFAGILVGILVSQFLFKDGTNNLSISDNTLKPTSKNNSLKPTVQENDTSKTKDYLPNKQHNSIVKDSSSNPSTNKIIASDTLTSGLTSDDSLSNIDENIVVLQEQMIAEKDYEILFLNDSIHNDSVITSPMDSALSSQLDIRPVVIEKVLSVEFWNSPIKFTGYKMSNKKLVIFVEEIPVINLYQEKEQIYLEKDGIIYQLQLSDEFLKLHSTTNGHIINLIKRANKI